MDHEVFSRFLHLAHGRVDHRETSTFSRINHLEECVKMSKLSALLILSVVLCAGRTFAEDAPAPKADKEAIPIAPYPLTTCVVSGKELGKMGDPILVTHNGRTFKLCCNGCVKKFNAEPEKYLKVLDEAEKKSKPDSGK